MKLTNIELKYCVGSERDEVEIETSLQDSVWRYSQMSNVVSQALADNQLDEFPFTLMVDRLEIEIPVEGETRSATAYVCGNAASAGLLIDGRSVIVQSDRKLLPRLTLAVEDPAEVRRAIQASQDNRRRWRNESEE